MPLVRLGLRCRRVRWSGGRQVAAALRTVPNHTADKDMSHSPAGVVSQDEVFAEQVRLLAANLTLGNWGGVLAIAIVGTVLRLTDWPPEYFALTLPILISLGVTLWVARASHLSSTSPERLAGRLVSLCGVAGALWGYLVFHLMSDDPVRISILFSLVLAQMVSAATGGACLLVSTIAFLLPMTILFIWAAVGLNSTLGHGVAVAALVMLALVIAYAREVNRVIVDSIRMRFENRALNEALTEQRVQERTRVLEAASRHKSEFLANMSHELRTPLNAIIGYSEMLQEEALDRDAGALVPDLRKIQAAGRQLLEMINAVLDLSKIEAGRMELHLEEVDVPALLDEIDAVMAPIAQRSGNRLERSIGPGVDRLRTDRGKLRQVLLNLLSNACKFTKDGTVRLEVERQVEHGETSIGFAVVDTGIGITAEQIGRLFQDFSQADSSTARQFGGTGLGLSLSRRLCRLMGGDISVTSTGGAGSRFVAWLPQRRDEATASSLVASASAPKVLVIDDDPAMRDLLERYLAKEGLRVLLASSGEQGLQSARVDHPDIITLDIKLPGRDGWSVLADLAGDPALAGIPVIVVSMLDDQSTGYALGASEYLTKPIDRERLVAAVRRQRQARSVLIVDDDPLMRQTLRRVLDAEGCSVVDAENGLVALQVLEHARPGLVLLDLLMPEMDGFEFLSTLRQRPQWRDTPVIVITAKEMTADDRARLNGSVVKVLNKCGAGHEQLFSDLRSLVERLLLARRGSTR
jgi:signal transduction histidine kinase/CheY-like chemotaxis protein